jgi:hypothetical protein
MRLSSSLLPELFDLEEDAYRLSIREAVRLGSGSPSVVLRAIADHASASLEALPDLAAARHVRVRSLRALGADLLKRLRDVVLDPIIDEEHAYRRTLATLHRGVDLVQLIASAAEHEDDDPLARFCHRFLDTRGRLLVDAAKELSWFGRHPFFARLTPA